MQISLRDEFKMISSTLVIMRYKRNHELTEEGFRRRAAFVEHILFYPYAPLPQSKGAMVTPSLPVTGILDL
jgi:hypothetical protein